MTTRASLEKRLSGYWKMELANALLLPVVLVVMAVSWGARIGPLTILAIPANVMLLAIGGLYWRAKLHRLTRRPETLRSLLPYLDRLQWVSLVLSVLAVGCAVAGWVEPSLSRSRGDRVLATIFAASAAAEYVNYFHRQLQHFDHLPDVRRLLSGRGFRRSQLAGDLARWRAS